MSSSDWQPDTHQKHHNTLQRTLWPFRTYFLLSLISTSKHWAILKSDLHSCHFLSLNFSRCYRSNMTTFILWQPRFFFCLTPDKRPLEGQGLISDHRQIPNMRPQKHGPLTTYETQSPKSHLKKHRNLSESRQSLVWHKAIKCDVWS